MKVNLVGIGSAKCGTTTIFEILDSHIDVCGSRPKEANFFSEEKNFCRGENWYHKTNYFHYAGQKYVLDFTPNYSGTKFAEAAERISKYNSKAKIIYIVRDPFKKLISGWQMCLRLAYMGVSTDNSAVPISRRGFSEWVGHQWAVGAIKSLYYGSVINEYLKYFPPSSIYIMSLESLSLSYRAEVLNLFSFLGLSTENFDMTVPVKSNAKRDDIGRLAFVTPLIRNSMLFRLPASKQIIYRLRVKWFLKDFKTPEPILEPHLASELAKLLNQDYLQCKIDLSKYTSGFDKFNKMCF